jgi:hypothetical protein
MALMKPRVMLLAVFTALVGLMIAPGDLDPFSGSIAILTIAAGAGAAGVLNMWYDADIDAVMARTAMRPIPGGTVSQAERFFGLVLCGSAVAVLRLRSTASGCSARFHDLFLRRCIHSMAEATDASEHRHWRCWRVSPVIGWVAQPETSGRADHFVSNHLPMDAAPFLGAVTNRTNEYAVRVSPCCRSLPEGPPQRDRFPFTAFFWCRFRCCHGSLALRCDLRRDRHCCGRSLLHPLQFGRSSEPTDALLIAYSCFLFSTCSCCSRRASRQQQQSMVIHSLGARCRLPPGLSKLNFQHTLYGSHTVPPISKADEFLICGALYSLLP